MAADLDAKILSGTRVTAIDTQAQRIHTADTEHVYSKLILALGAVRLRMAVLTVNDLADYAAFRSASDGKQRVVVLGSGLIGCEFANDLAHAGFAVDVVHPGEWPLERLLPVEAGRRLTDSLAAIGVKWHFGRTGKSIEGIADRYQVTLDNGNIMPRTQLAQAAGIAVKRGIVTNSLLENQRGECVCDGRLRRSRRAESALRAAADGAGARAGRHPFRHATAGAPMPVMVKTPAHPLAVLPPKIGATGGWQVECGDTGICALHLDDSGRMQSFALTGRETSPSHHPGQGTRRLRLRPEPETCLAVWREVFLALNSARMPPAASRARSSPAPRRCRPCLP